MNPYAIVRKKNGIGEDNSVFEEVFRTPSNDGDQQPVWGSSKPINELPDTLQIEVWDKNTFHSDTFCGAATIEMTKEINTFERVEYPLDKKGENTGVICVSLMQMAMLPANFLDEAA